MATSNDHTIDMAVLSQAIDKVVKRYPDMHLEAAQPIIDALIWEVCSQVHSDTLISQRANMAIECDRLKALLPPW